MLPSMILNPGCGVNAGAPRGDAAIRGDAEDFASDVVAAARPKDHRARSA
jgi:hypothetical protein